MEEKYKIQIFKNNEWVDTPLNELQKGDIFKIFEPDGKQIENYASEDNFFVAISNVGLNSDGNYYVELESYEL